MNTLQNYVAPVSDANASESELARLIAQLQNIHLLACEPRVQANYVLTRSIENLTVEVAICIARLDPQILTAIHA